MKIAILIPTRNREQLYLNLLEKLHVQILKLTEHEFSIFVINTSETNYTVSGTDLGISLSYSNIPSAGFVIPRNQLLSKLDDSYDVGIFMDDDQYPGAAWLRELIAPISMDGVVAVIGPTLPDFGSYSGWMSNLPFYYHHVELNSKSEDIQGGNVALDLRKIFPVLGKELFDMRFNLCGGEDTWLSRELKDRFGSTSIFLNLSAVAYEVIPLERLERKWVINRCRSTGKALAAIQKHRGGITHVPHRLSILLKSIFRITIIIFSIEKKSFKARALLVQSEMAKSFAYISELIL